MKIEEDKFTSKIDRIKSTIEYIQKDIDNIKHECYPEVNPDSNYYYDSSVLGNNNNFTNEENNAQGAKRLSPYKFKEDSNDQPLSKRKNELSRQNSSQNFMKKLNYNYSDTTLINKIGKINERVPSNSKYIENIELSNINHTNNRFTYNTSRPNNFTIQKNANNNIQQLQQGYNGEEESLQELRNKSNREKNIKVDKSSKRQNNKVDINRNEDDSNEVKYEYIYKELTSNNEYKVKTGTKTIDLSKDDLLNKRFNVNKKKQDLNSKSKSKSKSISKSISKRNASTDRPNLQNYSHKERFRPITTKDIQDIDRISNLSGGNEIGSEVESLRDKIQYLEKQNSELKRILTKSNLPIDTRKNYNVTSNTITTSYLNGDVGSNEFESKGYIYKTKNNNINMNHNNMNKNFPSTTVNKVESNNKFSKNNNPFNDNYLQSNHNYQYNTTNNNYEEIVLDTKTIEKNVQILIQAQKLLVRF